MTRNPRYKIVLEVLPRPGSPPIIRLRQFLKAALRQWGIRNQGIIEEHPDEDFDPYAGKLPEPPP